MVARLSFACQEPRSRGFSFVRAFPMASDVDCVEVAR